MYKVGASGGEGWRWNPQKGRIHSKPWYRKLNPVREGAAATVILLRSPTTLGIQDFTQRLNLPALSQPSTNFAQRAVRGIIKVNPEPGSNVSGLWLPMNRSHGANSVQDRGKAGRVFKGHHESSTAQLAIFSHLHSKLAQYLCTVKALPSETFLSLKGPAEGATAFHSAALSGCRLVTSDQILSSILKAKIF